MYELDCCFENVDVIRIGGFMNIFVLIIYDDNRQFFRWI
jgi:hypothetical protein